MPKPIPKPPKTKNKPRKPIKRAKTLGWAFTTGGGLKFSKRKPLNQVGKKTGAWLAQAKQAKERFFLRFGKMGGFSNDGETINSVAMCQVCKGGADKGGSDLHHKLKRSLGGHDDDSNLLLCHRKCHAWLHDHKRAWALQMAERDSANLENGYKIILSADRESDLHAYLKGAGPEWKKRVL